MAKDYPGIWHVYLLECADGVFYCGVTTDVHRRLAQHNGLLPGGARFTRGRRPVRLVASRGMPSRCAALRMERSVKNKQKKWKLHHLLHGMPISS